MTGRPWRRGALWLAGLAPFFYLTYGFANWLASVRADVPAVVFAFERWIPFLPWTIIPYWSINAFYGLSLFLWADRRSLDRHGLRLLTAQLVAVACFILFPLRFTFEKPDHGGGLAGFLFDALAGFDKPFNQAPSLHIALLVILWDAYRRLAPRVLHPLVDAWSLLIAVSVLTTFQHHFIDLPTGALLGLFCLWLWPLEGAPPLAGASLTPSPRRRRLAAAYLAGGLVLFALALAAGGGGLWLAWPAVSLALVSLAYGLAGAAAFQKAADGRMSLAVRLLAAPYILAAFINSRLWTRHDAASVPVADGVHLGRMPGFFDRSPPPATRLVDLAAELPPPRRFTTRSFPALDLAVPDPALLAAAADAIEAERRQGPVLVACALGYSRSVAATAVWLVRTGRAADGRAAIASLAALRPGLKVGYDLARAIDEAAAHP